MGHLSAGQRRVGFVFQHYALFKHLNVTENIAFGLRVRPRSNRPGRRRSSSGWKNFCASCKSRIWARVILIKFPGARASGSRSPARWPSSRARLLLDEPFGALDAKVRKELRRWLRTLQRELNLTTIFVTHDQDEALEIADRVAIMNRGRIEQIGTPNEVYDRPASPFVFEFLGDVNRVVAHGSAQPLCPAARYRD